MSTQFYKRYVPSAAGAPESETASTPKRKRTAEEASPAVADVAEKKSKKRKPGDAAEVSAKKERKKEKKAKKKEWKEQEDREAQITKEALEAQEAAEKKAEKAEMKGKKDKKKRKTESENAEETLPTPAPTPAETEKVKTAVKEKKTKKEKNNKDRKATEGAEERAPQDDTPMEDAVPTTETTPAKKKKEKKSKKPVPEITEETPDLGSGALNILSKLRKSVARAAELAAKGPAEPEPTGPQPELAEPVAPEGLQHLPQPEENTATKPVSLLSSLPSWLQHPISVSPSTTTPFKDIPNLSPKLVQRLESQSLTSAFAVQTAVLPLLLQPSESDILISAATGSGKTLAYTIPIIQALSSRVVTRLRAIIVVPTRELVQQVHATTTSLAVGTHLKVGTAIGSRALATEQSLLVAPATETDPATSKVDILITTPGRLVEHVSSTPGFDLSSVRYLIIDEADRLLAQSFQEWVDIVIGGLHRALASRQRTHHNSIPLSRLALRPQRHEVTKIVLSATMTRDVGKLADLRLRKPRMIVVEDPALPEEAARMVKEAEEAGETGELEEQFSVPAKLTEHVTSVENLEYKPLVMLYLLINHAIKTGVLVFVKSNEGAARLAKLLQSVCEKRGEEAQKWRIELVTGEMERKRREKVLKRFARGEVDILICSDLVSRGLDLPNVRHVINYDIPASVRAYVHRVGRTARAGAEGDAWTLISDKEARWFWKSVGRQIRRVRGLEKVGVEMEAEGWGVRGVYEQVLYGEA